MLGHITDRVLLALDTLRGAELARPGLTSRAGCSATLSVVKCVLWANANPVH